MNHINLFLTCHKDQTEEAQINMLLFNMYLFATREKKAVYIEKLKMIVRTWIEDFELSDGPYSVSSSQYYIEYIIEKHQKITTIPPIHVYIIELITD